MKRIRSLSLVAAAAALTLSLTAGGSALAEPLPYGHKDFVPTPERPVYFRQTLGYYPGAQPPLEFWDGTPTTREVEYPDRHNPKVMRKTRIPDFAPVIEAIKGK